MPLESTTLPVSQKSLCRWNCATTTGSNRKILRKDRPNPSPPCAWHINSKEYGKVTWALVNFIPLTQSARTVKDVDLTALSVRLNFLYHLLYPQNVFFLCINTFWHILRGVCWTSCWFPGSVTIKIVVLSSPKLLLQTTGKKHHITWHVFVECSVVWTSATHRDLWTSRGFCWNSNYSFPTVNSSSPSTMGNLRGVLRAGTWKENRKVSLPFKKEPPTNSRTLYAAAESGGSGKSRVLGVEKYARISRETDRKVVLTRKDFAHFCPSCTHLSAAA